MNFSNDFEKQSYIAGMQTATIERGLVYETDGQAERAIEKAAAYLDDEYTSGDVIEFLVDERDSIIKEAEFDEWVNEEFYKTAMPILVELVKEGKITTAGARDIATKVMKTLSGAKAKAIPFLEKMKTRGISAGKAIKEMPGKVKTKGMEAGKYVKEKGVAAGKAIKEAPGKVKERLIEDPKRLKRLEESAPKSDMMKRLKGKEIEFVKKRMKGTKKGLGLAAGLTGATGLGYGAAKMSEEKIAAEILEKMAEGEDGPNTLTSSSDTNAKRDAAERPVDKYKAIATKMKEDEDAAAGEEKSASLDDIITAAILEKMADGSGSESPNDLEDSMDSDKDKTTGEQDKGIGASSELPRGEAEEGTTKDVGMPDKGNEEQAKAPLKTAAVETIVKEVLAQLQKQSDGSGTEADNTLATSMDSEKEKTTKEQDHGMGAGFTLPRGQAEEGTTKDVGMPPKGQEPQASAPLKTSSLEDKIAAAVLQKVKAKLAQEGMIEEETEEEVPEEEEGVSESETVTEEETEKKDTEKKAKEILDLIAKL